MIAVLRITTTNALTVLPLPLPTTTMPMQYQRCSLLSYSSRRTGSGSGRILPVLVFENDHRRTRSRRNIHAPLPLLLFKAEQADHTGITTDAPAITPATPTPTATAFRQPVPVPRRYKTLQITPQLIGQDITVCGWIRTIRKQKALAFAKINDGSNNAGIQVVLTNQNNHPNQENNNGNITMDDADKAATATATATAAANAAAAAALWATNVQALTTGTAVRVVGTVVASPNPHQQAVELRVDHPHQVQILGPCPPDTYPLAKKKHSDEYIRTIAHLRPRTQRIAAIARIRSQLAFAIHEFFQRVHQFVYVQTPLITTSDCEGAGELFRVTTMDLTNINALPRAQNYQSHKSNNQNNSHKKKKLQQETTHQEEALRQDDTTNDADADADAKGVDFAQDFFGKAAFLTVSGQLAGEAYACALGDIYTFGPTFRAENSQTSRHLAEFHMVEPELAFCDLHGVMDNAEQLIQYVVQHVLTHCRDDLLFCHDVYNNDVSQRRLVEKLEHLTHTPFVRIPYTDAIAILQDAIAQNPLDWQFPIVHFGTDLATEHERYLVETHFHGTPVLVTDFPKRIKAFYMKDNVDNTNMNNNTEEDDDDKFMTVAAMDLLVPGVGELIGGSQREDSLERLERKMRSSGLDPDTYRWYLDLRRFGSIPHAGYGLGFERLVTWVSGVDNIRDAIAFPRYPGNAES